MSSAQIDNMLLRCPVDVKLAIFGDWLSLEEICRFDSALCNRALRDDFHGNLSSKNFVYNSDDELSLISACLSWLCKRSLSVSSVEISSHDVSLEMLQAYTHRCGSKLKQVSVNNNGLEIIEFSVLEDIIQNCQNIVHLCLRHCEILVSSSQESVHCVSCHVNPKLETLDLSYSRISRRVFGALFGHCKNLKVLRMPLDVFKDTTYRDGSTTPELVESISAFTELTQWDMMSTDTDMDLDYEDICVKVIESNVHLQKVDFWYLESKFMCTDKILMRLSRHCPQLSDLNLCRCNLVSDSGFRVLFEGCNNISTLQIADCMTISNETLKQLPHAFPKLTLLDVSRLHMTGRTFLHIITHAPLLQTFVCMGCANISDDLPALEDVEMPVNFVSSLTNLNLRWCDKLTDDLLYAIMKVAPRLECINLIFCRMLSAEAIKTLIIQYNTQLVSIQLNSAYTVDTIIEHCSANLTHVCFIAPTELSRTAGDKIKAAFPDCKVIIEY